jgi:uncharacterized DUF497 family protein
LNSQPPVEWRARLFALVFHPQPVEQRTLGLLLLGHSHARELLVVVHTERGDNIRIISARRAGRRERKSYEESN